MARVVVQRVRSASVTVDGAVAAEIAAGLTILIGIKEGDDDAAVDRLADKVGSLRIFEDEAGKMNLSTAEIGGAMLVVSQFTLYADVRKGRRPSFIAAARPELGKRLYLRFADRLRSQGFNVQQGVFGAQMLVALENAGPVTLVIDSQDL
jgi:D-tyrosyl-tRNA(Tyr) deacylase